jgi:hypothetical protein
LTLLLRKRRNEKMAAFITLLSEGCHVSTAAKKLSVTRQMLYMWRERHKPFAKAWDQAVEDGHDFLEEVIRGHSVKDWRTAEALLKTRRPGVWREKRSEQPATNINIMLAEAEGASVRLADRIDGIARALRARKDASGDERGRVLPGDAPLEPVGPQVANGAKR